MKVIVKRDLCQGHNRCASAAPEVFEVDELGTAYARNDGEVPPDLEETVRLCAANCPEYAIEVIE